MVLSIFPTFFKWVPAAATIILFVLKYRDQKQFNELSNRRLGNRWLWWYKISEIHGTSSDSFRRFMKHNNQITSWL